MSTSLAEQNIHLREFRWEDIPPLVDINNRTTPDDPSTIENQEHQEKTYPADNPRLRYAVENAAGKFIGLGVCLHPFWMNAPGVYFMWIIVDPAWRRRGIGQTLLTEFEAYARRQGAEKLWTDCRDDQDYSIRFLEYAGFHNFGVRYEAVLDLATFDESRFAGAVDRAVQAGFEFTNLAAERVTNPEADRQVYELDRVTRAEVPWPGGARSEMSYEQFRHRFFDNPESDPSAILIAKYHGQLIGLTTVWLGKNRPAHTAMTGVRRGYRGQGVALALKLLSFRMMKERGYTEALTDNDTANPPILHLNDKLGYQNRHGDQQWEKRLT